MSDNENNIFDLEGDALDEALLAAIDETDEEERLAREKKAQENQKKAEQARVTAIQQEKRKAEIDELRKNLPNEGRRYFLMTEEAECDEENNKASVAGTLFGTCKKDDQIYLYRNDGRVLASKVLTVEAFNGQVYEPADEVSQSKARITFTVDYAKTGFTKENAVPKFAVLTSVKPPLKDDAGKIAIENPALSGLMFKYAEFKQDKEYVGRLLDNVIHGRFLIPGFKESADSKKLKIVMVTKKDDPNTRVLPLFTDLQALYLWRKLITGDQKPSVIVMGFPEVAKFIEKDKFDVVINPSGPVPVGLPAFAIDSMSKAIKKSSGGVKVDKETIKDGSKVVLGEPRPCEETDNIRAAITSYCKSHRDIKKAGLLYIIRNNKMSYLVIVDTTKTAAPLAFKGLTEAIKPHLNTIKTVDFSLLSEAPFANDYYSKKPWDYRE